MRYFQLNRFLFFGGLFIIALSMLLKADGQRASSDKIGIEWTRLTILEAEAMLNSGDSDFWKCVNHWRQLSMIMPLIDEDEILARVKFLRLLCLNRSLESLPRRRVPALELKAWLNVQSEYIYFCDRECSNWLVNAEIFWNLRNEYAGFSIADDIAWAAATNHWGNGCEDFASCELSKWMSSMGEYIKTNQDGKYVFLALEQLVDICQRIQTGELSISGNDLMIFSRKIVDLLNAAGEVNKTRYYEYAMESLESTNKAIRKVGGQAQGRRLSPHERSDILGGSFEEWMEDWYRPHPFRDLNDYFYYWGELKRLIPNLADKKQAATAKLIRLLCLKRMLGLLNEENMESQEIRAWREEIKELIKVGAVQSEVFWDLCEEYAEFPIADDIAWAAANNLDRGDRLLGPDLWGQLVDLNSTLVRYLGLFPDGKYSRLALSTISSFCRYCRGEDRILRPPDNLEKLYALEDVKKELDTIHETLRRVVSSNATSRIALQTVKDFESTFKISNHSKN